MKLAKLFHEFTQQFSATLPPNLLKFRKEFEEQFQIGLESAFRKLNCIPRTEFETQTVLLERIHKKVEQLEEKIRSLESLTHLQEK